MFDDGILLLVCSAASSKVILLKLAATGTRLHCKPYVILESLWSILLDGAGNVFFLGSKSA